MKKFLVLVVVLSYLSVSIVIVRREEGSILEEEETNLSFLEQKRRELEEKNAELQQKNERLVHLESLLAKQNNTAARHLKTLQEEKDKHFQKLQLDNEKTKRKLEQQNDRVRELERKLEESKNMKQQEKQSVKPIAEDEQTKILLEEQTQKVQELEKSLEIARSSIKTLSAKARDPIVDRVGIKPLRIAVTHHPHNDRLGSFCSGAIKLLAVAYRWGWDFEVLPYEGSGGMRYLQKVMRGESLYGNDFMAQASTGKDYDPVELNRRAYDTLAFFPNQTHPVPPVGGIESPWIEVPKGFDLPRPGDPALVELCAQKPLDEGNGYVRCRITFPYMRESTVLIPHMKKYGGMDAFFTPEFRKMMRDAFMQHNSHRIKFFSKDAFNVALHVRRGDVNPTKYKERYVSQSTFASLSRYLCQKHKGAHIHVFSNGNNTDGNWDTLSAVTDTCASIQFHIDEPEFDTWAHFVAADALVISKSSTFGIVPAYMNAGEVYDTAKITTALSHWHVWTEDGLFK